LPKRSNARPDVTHWPLALGAGTLPTSTSEGAAMFTRQTGQGSPAPVARPGAYRLPPLSLVSPSITSGVVINVEKVCAFAHDAVTTCRDTSTDVAIKRPLAFILIPLAYESPDTSERTSPASLVVA